MQSAQRPAAGQLDTWILWTELRSGVNSWESPYRHRFLILLAALEQRAECLRVLKRSEKKLSDARAVVQTFALWRRLWAPAGYRQACERLLAAEQAHAQVKRSIAGIDVLPRDLVGSAQQEIDRLRPLVAQEDADAKAVRQKQLADEAAALAAATAAAAAAAAASAKTRELELLPLDAADGGADAGASSSGNEGGAGAPAAGPSFTFDPLSLSLSDDDEPEQHSFEVPR